jgi:hypothetical protein
MTTLKAQRAAEVLANRHINFGKRVATLTGHVASRTPAIEMAIALNDGKTADQFAAEIAAREPVGAALHPQKIEAVKAAAMDAAVTVGAIQLKLEQAGWDLNVLVPEPKSVWDRDYKAIRAKRNLIESLTERADGSYSYARRGQPDIRKMDPKGIARFIERAEQDAALQYDAFICKMVKKIGEGAVTARIEGEHIWGYSFLTVTLKDGSSERWKTQQIINTSIHGLRFPQWPSRKVK